jgi:glutamine amidotransferase
VLDWGGGNLGSVRRAFERLGARPVITSDPAVVEGTGRLVLPGVGAFGAVMDGLKARGLIGPLTARLRADSGPFLGICVGLQALFEGSEETQGTDGLGLLAGHVRRLQARRVPHTGWNEVIPTDAADPVLERGYAYFVNSYAALAEVGGPWIAARTFHEHTFASAVRLGARALAVQFHPEKSGAYGAALLTRWLERG